MSWIQTYTGRQFYPLAPKPADVDTRDVAHALALVCRFTGHVRRFYSVAEHSVRVSFLAEQLAQQNGHDAGTALHIARRGLLHDASEAYLCDVASPLKRSPGFEAYRDAEREVQKAILAACGMAPHADEPAEVKFADLLMLSTEKAELLGPEPAPWGELPAPLPRQNLGWDPVFAEGQFLFRFRDLFVQGVPA